MALATVFVSHRATDAVLAAKLADDLQAAGHVVWLDQWRLAIGQSNVDAINAGLETSSYLVLCYSSAGVSSPWMSREWMSALARQLNGAHIAILPVCLSGDDVPAILADIQYVDLRKDWASGIARLVASIV